MTPYVKSEKMIINKTKYAWRWIEGPAGLCQFENPGHDLWAQKCMMGGDTLFTYAASWLLGTPRVGVFPGKWLESSQLCSGAVQPRAGNCRVEPGSERLGCRMLTAGSVPHSLRVRGKGPASQLSIFQNTLPFHGFQTGLTLKLCWKYLGLGRFFSGEDFIPRA